jgi:hypothetical protein
MEGGAGAVMTFVWKEDDDRRVFAAVRFVNAVDLSQISGPLEFTAVPSTAVGPPSPNQFLPTRIVRNRRGLHVIHSGTMAVKGLVADQLQAYVDQFLPTPSKPDKETLRARLRVRDLSGAFLPTDFSMDLPRDPIGRDPAHSLSAPLEVRMYPSPAAPVASSWAPLRVMIWRIVAAPTAADAAATRTQPLRGALVRALLKEDGVDLAHSKLLGSGVTEWRQRVDGMPADCAEALVALRDILVTKWGSTPGGPVFTDSQQVRLEVCFDPTFDPDTSDAPPNLEALETKAPGVIAAELPATFVVRARQQVVRRIIFDKENHLSDFPTG